MNNTTILYPSTSVALQVYLHEDNPNTSRRQRRRRHIHRMFPFSCGVTSTESTVEPTVSSERGRTEGSSTSTAFDIRGNGNGGITPLQKLRILRGGRFRSAQNRRDALTIGRCHPCAHSLSQPQPQRTCGARAHLADDQG